MRLACSRLTFSRAAKELSRALALYDTHQRCYIMVEALPLLRVRVCTGKYIPWVIGLSNIKL